MAMIDIDLGKYGGEGIVTIGPQSLRAQRILKNETTKKIFTITAGEEGKQPVMTPKEVDAGDIEILQVLSYVRKAPFQPMVDSFMEYCDRLEEKIPGASVELYEAMRSAVEEVSAKPSPLEH